MNFPFIFTRESTCAVNTKKSQLPRYELAPAHESHHTHRVQWFQDSRLGASSLHHFPELHLRLLMRRLFASIGSGGARR